MNQKQTEQDQPGNPENRRNRWNYLVFIIIITIYYFKIAILSTFEHISKNILVQILFFFESQCVKTVDFDYEFAIHSVAKYIRLRFVN